MYLNFYLYIKLHENLETIYFGVSYTTCSYVLSVRMQRSNMSAFTNMEIYFKKDFMQHTGRSVIYPFNWKVVKGFCAHNKICV